MSRFPLDTKPRPWDSFFDELPDPGFDLDGTDLVPYIQDAQRDLLPKPASGGPRIAVPVHLPPATLDALKRLAEERGIGYTTLAARWIEAAIAEATADDQAMVPLAEIRRVIGQLATRSAPPST